MPLLRTSEACKELGISPNTIRKWANEGKIKYIKTDGGHRRYEITKAEDDRAEKENVIYARVSSAKQQADLRRQVEFLSKKYPNAIIIRDTASSLNYKRRGLNRLLELVCKTSIKKVIVYSPDRLCRFSHELLETVFRLHGTEIVYLSKEGEERSPNEELAEDILSVVTFFSARYHGRRKCGESDGSEESEDAKD